ncbi:MAG: large conductance mechanosensitive channel protein MscL [Solirubrobacterales bacterium]
MRGILGEFKEFISRGNLVELAVAVVIGTAFAALVKSFVDNLITPIIAAIFGKPSFGDLAFNINGSEFGYGNFINALITFLSVAVAIFFFVVKPMNVMTERARRGEDPDVRECPECLSEIPYAATRCAHCTTQLTGA